MEYFNVKVFHSTSKVFNVFICRLSHITRHNFIFSVIFYCGKHCKQGYEEQYIVSYFYLHITVRVKHHSDTGWPQASCANRTWNLKPVIKAREGNYFLSKGAILLNWKEKFHLQNSRRKSLWWMRVLARSLRFNTTENLRLQAAISFQYFVACFYAPFQSYCFRYIASFLIHGNLKFY